MQKNLVLVKLDKEYCDYLRTFDSRVPFNYARKENRPFVGVLFMIDECMYFAPLSSPKTKHLKIKAKLDLFKIDDGKLGAVNFNNMLPVMEENIVKIELNKEKMDEDEQKYNKLLKNQIYWLNRNRELLYYKSSELYKRYVNRTLSKKIALRCCDFKILEKACKEYHKKIK